MNQIAVTVTGESRVELVKNLRAFADNLDGSPAEPNGKVAAKTSKKAAAASFDEDDAADDAEVESKGFDDEDDTEATDDADDTEASFDDEEPAPKKEAAKTGKAKKVTLEEVNAACHARAAAGGKKGRAEVLAILKKNFKTETISEIKPEQYGKLVSLMKVSN